MLSEEVILAFRRGSGRRETRRGLLLAFLLFVSLALLDVSGRAQEVTLEWQTCVNFGTLFSTKQGCYILDTKTGQKKIEVQIGVGINVNAGTVLIGSGASTMLVVHMVYPASGDSKADLAKAIKQCEAELKKPENQKKILELYKKSKGRSPDTEPKNWQVPALEPIPVSDMPESVRQMLRTSIPA
jgi:hypothetical protein